MRVCVLAIVSRRDRGDVMMQGKAGVMAGNVGGAAAVGMGGAVRGRVGCSGLPSGCEAGARHAAQPRLQGLRLFTGF